MSINRTLSLDIEATLAEIDSYRSIFGYQQGIALGNAFSQARYVIPVSESLSDVTDNQLIFSSISLVFILVTNIPVTTILSDVDSSATFTTNSVQILTGPIESVVVQNPLTNTVEALLTVVYA